MAAKKTATKSSRSVKTVKSKARVPKPALEFDDLHDRGKKAYDLASQHDDVKERLPTGLLSDLKTDLEIILPHQQETIIAASEVRAATKAQDEAMVDLYKTLSAARNSIKKTVKSPSIRNAYGFDIKLNASSLPALTSGALKLVGRARENTDEARGLGILEKDLVNLETLITSVESADGKQRDLIVAKPKTTQERNAAGHRVWNAIKTISSRGVLAFPLNEELRAKYDVLDDLPKKPAKKK